MEFKKLFYLLTFVAMCRWEYPGIQWLGLSASIAGAAGLISGQGPKILHAMRPKKENQTHCQFPV